MNDANNYVGPAQLVYGRTEPTNVSGEATLHGDEESNTWSGTFSFDHSFEWDVWNVIYGGDPDVPIKLQIANQTVDVHIKGEHGTHLQGEINVQGEGPLPG